MIDPRSETGDNFLQCGEVVRDFDPEGVDNTVDLPKGLGLEKRRTNI